MNGIPYADLREFLAELDRRGKLHRWKQPLNKDRDLGPLMRLQYRGLPEDARQAFLYESVVDSKGNHYGMRVAMGAYGASRSVLSLGLGCEDPQQVCETWREALRRPLDPVIVERGPAQEEVHIGSELQEHGLARLPVPVEDPGFSGGIRTTSPILTRDPETGMRNVGMYSGHLYAKDKMLAGIASPRHARVYHIAAAQTRREPLPVAIAIGTLPDIAITASANLPYGVDELSIAGALRGRPVELVRCKTIPLEVPAEAEIVIEGQLYAEERDRPGAFGDYPGYMMSESHLREVIKVSAITCRRNAIFPAILVGLPPSESNTISRTFHEVTLYNHLKYGCGHPEVIEVACPEMGGGSNWWVIRIRNRHPSLPSQILHAAAGLHSQNKFIIVVDEDINPRDPDMVMWALSFAVQPHRDVDVITGRVPILDPSVYTMLRRPEDRGFPPPSGASGMLIDATRKGPYPPVGLPAQQFMERALEMWKAERMPELHLREPWHGYSLGGFWTEEDEERARRAAQGDAM